MLSIIEYFRSVYDEFLFVTSSVPHSCVNKLLNNIYSKLKFICDGNPVTDTISWNSTLRFYYNKSFSL